MFAVGEIGFEYGKVTVISEVHDLFNMEIDSGVSVPLDLRVFDTL